MIKKLFNKLLQFQDLTFDESKLIMDNIMEGKLTPTQIGGILVALRMKKETIDEISGMASSMREHASKISPHGQLVDTCGTGGDMSDSFNISTTSAFIAAGCGIKIAKHGNRSVSSKCGSADLLEGLGVNINLTPQQVEACINEVGIGFMFAPKFHGAMKHAIPARKELGIRTVFNILGPLTNPAETPYQVLGVFDADLTEIMANVLKKLGAKKALVVHGQEGLDEMSICGPTKISKLDTTGQISTYQIDPADYGMQLASPEEIKGGEIKENIQITKEILAGTLKGAKRDIAILNAAAAIIAVNKSDNFQAAITMAQKSIDSGAALKKVKELAQYTQTQK